MTKKIVAVVGLGYVGLPVAVAFSQKFETIGFDINECRINQLKDGIDNNQEIAREQLQTKNLDFSNEPSVLKRANFIIVAVPTPIDASLQPDLTMLLDASQLIGQHLEKR